MSYDPDAVALLAEFDNYIGTEFRNGHWMAEGSGDYPARVRGFVAQVKEMPAATRITPDPLSKEGGW